MPSYEALRAISDGSNGERRMCLMGELDRRSARGVRAALHDEIAASSGGVVVVDCAGMDFIDSTGLGVLVGALKVARDRGGDLRVEGLRPAARKVFEITRLTKVFDLK
jgi:anti-sigma B factor antagonist